MSACPKCTSLLSRIVVVDGGGLVSSSYVHACESCGGVFLDNEMSQQLVRGILAHRVTEIAEDVDRNAHARGVHPYREIAGGGCPSCGVPMTRVTTTRASHGIDHLELDVCAAHGTWFDAQELVTLREALAEKRFDDGVARMGRAIELEQAVEGVYPKGLSALREALSRGGRGPILPRRNVTPF